MKVRCHLCGYQGVVPASPDLKEEALEGVMKIDITILGLFLDFRVGKCERLC